MTNNKGLNNGVQRCTIASFKQKTLVLALGAAMLPCGLVPVVNAADNQLELEEVVITATRRSENLLDVAQSIGVLTDDFFEDTAFESLSQFAGQVPGLNFTERGPGQTSINIRGISADPGTQSVSTVGVYIDDVALTNDDQNSQADIRAFDLERVEILRGPQGTLYGEGAVGGVVRYITKKANSEEFEGALELSLGSINGGEETTSVNAMLNIPLIQDKLALRLVGMRRDMGGYIDNPVLGAEDFNSADISTGRASLVWDATDKLSMSAMAIFNRIDVDGDNITRGGGESEFIAPALNPREDDYDLYSLTLNYEAEAYSITSVTGYSRRESSKTTVESDLALLFFVQPISAFFSDVAPTQSIFVFNEDNKNFTQEIRVVSTTESPLQWTAGLWYRDGDFENEANRHTSPTLTYGGNGDLTPLIGFPIVLGPNPLGGPAGEPIPGGFSQDPSTSTFENTAVFGEVSYDLNDQFEILLGGRWFKETRGSQSPIGTGGLNEAFQLLDALFGLPPAEPTDDEFEITAFTPKATLTYRHDEDTMTYLTYGEGVRSGGRNGQQSVVLGQSCREFYDEDTTSSFELGLKKSSSDGRMSLEAATFYTDWKDLQVLFFNPETFDSCTENAGSAHSLGAEISFTALITDGLTFNLNGSWTEAELDEDLIGADSLGSVIPKGTQLPNVPEYKVGASVVYEWDLFTDWTGKFNANISAVGDSKAALEPGVRGDLEQPSYTISNVSVGMQNGDLGVHLFVNNLTDEYAVFADDTFGGIHRNQPRTVGIILRAGF